MNAVMSVDGAFTVLGYGQNSEEKPQKCPPPSDPNFDRKLYSDSEYIELLKAEIRDLQKHLNERDTTIQKLTQSKPDAENGCTNNVEGQIVTGSRNSQDKDIPQRSARRNDEFSHQTLSVPPKFNSAIISEDILSKREKRDSITSITSNGPIDVRGGMLLSPDLKTELNAASLAVHLGESSLEETEMKSLFSDFENKHEVTDNELTFPGRIRSTGADSYMSYNKLKTTNFNDTTAGSSALGQSVTTTSSVFKPRIRVPLSQSALDSFNLGEDSSLAKNSRESSQVFSALETGNGITSRIPSPESVLGSQPQKEANPEVFPRRNLSHNSTDERDAVRIENTSKSMFVTSNAASDLPRTRDDGKTLGQAMETLPGSQFSPKIGTGKPAGSSFTVLSSMEVEEDDVSLFIQPKDFYTVRIKVVSTITVNSRRTDDFNCTFSINDKETNKEMWRFRKSFTQIMSFDSEIRPFIEFFGLPPLPDKSTFNSATPIKVDLRSQALQRYFDNIFQMPHIPQMVLLRICKYISVDFVNPLDDFRSGAKKEGFLIRRYKGLGSTWKVRWCQVDGPDLEIYDLPGGSLIEQIKLSGSQIGRQSSDTAAEERGYRHAFLVLESSKSLKISGFSPKHFFCAESDKERDEWIAAMVEFTDNDPLLADQKSVSTAPSDFKDSILNISEDLDNDEPNRQTYSSSGQSPMSTNLNVDDIDSQNFPDDSKQYRKTKMRHYFPFRSKHGQGQDSVTPNPQADPVSAHQISDQGMETYLNKLDLSEEQSKAIFGRDLRYAFALSNDGYEGVRIPSVCFRCFDYLKRTGAIYEEGIFRLSGSASTIRVLKENFNSNFDVDLFESPLKPDIHTVSGLLKMYLRELPHSLFGDKTYNELQRIVTENSKLHLQSQISMMIREFMRSPGSIDEIAFNFCFVVFGFLRSVVINSSSNKMSLKNVCIVFVPTLNISVDVLHLCLIDFDCIFGDLAPVPDQDREILDLQIPLF